MLVSAAVCPHPPLLVPEVAGEAASELDGLRAACAEAVRRLGDADVVVVVGGADETRAYGPGATGTLKPYGLDRRFGPEGGEPLPLSLTIGCWLLRDLAGTHVRYQSVAFGAAPEECLGLGRALADSAGRVALLVMGDGTACLSQKAPGYLDERAEAFDAEVAKALGHADAAALAALSPELSGELQAAGRAAWQVLAGAVTAPGAGPFGAEPLAHEAPYGVGYHVASWLHAPTAPVRHMPG
ncbi:hypothetical protein [Spirillospora sp. CA-294931]|uniref:hypothetical protein n=1 Tax=Spirillospora sp. CA-294931 TaxID=3240042 RepID=UPI003D8E02FC